MQEDLPPFPVTTHNSLLCFSFRSLLDHRQVSVPPEALSYSLLPYRPSHWHSKGTDCLPPYSSHIFDLYDWHTLPPTPFHCRYCITSNLCPCLFSGSVVTFTHPENRLSEAHLWLCHIAAQTISSSMLPTELNHTSVHRTPQEQYQRL